MQTSTFWLKFGSLRLAVTLKIMSRSPKPIQLFMVSQCHIHANLVKICQPIHENDIEQTSTFWLKYQLSPAVTLTIRPRHQPNQLFMVSQCYSHRNLVKICHPVHEM